MKLFVLGALLLGACPDAASDTDDRQSPIAAPCEGCLLELPNRSGPVPLVVVLHGDKEQAQKWFERWRGPALERGFGVLALQCPENLGCSSGRWYRWNGKPRWVISQVAAVADEVPIDRSRTFLVGWSGGATYIGMHADRWHRDFAGVVIHGGGAAPRHKRCPRRPMLAYFLVGDRNAHHDATARFREYFEDCGTTVSWDLIEGADHDAEDESLDARKAGTILDWLAEHARAGAQRTLAGS